MEWIFRYFKIFLMKYIASKYISFDRKNTPQILDTMRKEMKCSLMNFQGKKTKKNNLIKMIKSITRGQQKKNLLI